MKGFKAESKMALPFFIHILFGNRYLWCWPKTFLHILLSFRLDIWLRKRTRGRWFWNNFTVEEEELKNQGCVFILLGRSRWILVLHQSLIIQRESGLRHNKGDVGSKTFFGSPIPPAGVRKADTRIWRHGCRRSSSRWADRDWCRTRIHRLWPNRKMTGG